MLCEELLFATALGAMAEVAFKWGLTLVKECVSDGATAPSTHDEVAAKKDSEDSLDTPPAMVEHVASVFTAPKETREHQIIPEANIIDDTTDITKTWDGSNRTKSTKRRQSLGPDGAPCLVLSSTKVTPPRSRGSKLHLPVGALPEDVPTKKLTTIAERPPKKSTIDIAADIKRWNDLNHRAEGTRNTRRRQSLGPESDPRLGVTSKKATPPRSRGGKKSKGAQSIMKKIKQLNVTPSASTISNGSTRRRSVSPPRRKVGGSPGSSKQGDSTKKATQ